MVAQTVDLKECIDQVYTTLSSCRKNIRSRALLRNQTILQLIISNKTRCSGKCLILEKFCQIYESLKSVAESDTPNVPMNLSPNFRDSMSRYSVQLKEIDHVNKYLQKSNRSL